MSEPGQPTELEPLLIGGATALTNAQAALLAASANRLSIVSSDADMRAQLARAAAFKRWLDSFDDVTEES